MSRRISEEVAAKVTLLVVEEGRAVFRSALRVTGGDWSDAEDLVQEAFQAAASNWDKIGGWPRRQQRSWLRRVVINKKIDRWRVGRRMQVVAEIPDVQESTSADRIVLSKIALDRCWEVIKSMPPERAKVAYLRWRMEWSTKEIAEWNGIAQSTVRGHLMSALQQLNEEVGPEMPFIDDVNDTDADQREEA